MECRRQYAIWEGSGVCMQFWEVQGSACNFGRYRDQHAILGGTGIRLRSPQLTWNIEGGKTSPLGFEWWVPAPLSSPFGMLPTSLVPKPVLVVFSLRIHLSYTPPGQKRPPIPYESGIGLIPK
ncbi:hypothetical protein VNO77_03920 [Canavalia gladiata]|uniref:Uncharacterized protein n=1 Tax=Canavalia gladiata TaxID=3824 RepID=A0AAN9R4C8_CANGL